jgi:hypothetical protein
MTTWTWIVKTETEDSQRALEIVQDQRNRGYTAWIEDEHGRGIDEESLKIGKAERTKQTLYERVTGALVVVAAAVAAIGTLYLIGLWVDR